MPSTPPHHGASAEFFNQLYHSMTSDILLTPTGIPAVLVLISSSCWPYMPYVPDWPGYSRILIPCPGIPENVKLSLKF